MEEKLLRFAKILAIKSKLICYDVDDLIKEYRSPDSFILFVESIEALVEDDKEFFSFTELKRDVLEVFSLYRYQNIDKEIKDKMNKIISIFNTMKPKDEEEASNAIIDYCTKEIIKRNFIIYPDSLLESIANDIDVFISIFEDDLENFEEKKFVMASLYYFGNLFPEMYKDEEIREVVFDYLEKVKKEKSPFKRNFKGYVKDINKKFLEK